MMATTTNSEQGMAQIIFQKLQKACNFTKTVTLDFCSPEPIPHEVGSNLFEQQEETNHQAGVVWG